MVKKNTIFSCRSINHIWRLNLEVFDCAIPYRDNTTTSKSMNRLNLDIACFEKNTGAQENRYTFHHIPYLNNIRIVFVLKKRWSNFTHKTSTTMSTIARWNCMARNFLYWIKSRFWMAWYFYTSLISIRPLVEWLH